MGIGAVSLGSAAAMLEGVMYGYDKLMAIAPTVQTVGASMLMNPGALTIIGLIGGAGIMSEPVVNTLKKITMAVIESHLDQPLGLHKAEKSLEKVEAKRDKFYPPSAAKLAQRLDAKQAASAAVAPAQPSDRKALSM